MRIGPAFGYDVGKISAGCLIQKIVNASAVLAGLPSHLLNRLQSVLNAAARLVCRARKYDHVTHLFRDLHWLRVPERLQFRLAVLAFCCRNQKGLRISLTSSIGLTMDPCTTTGVHGLTHHLFISLAVCVYIHNVCVSVCLYMLCS